MPATNAHFSELIAASAADEARARWQSAIRRELWRWRVLPDGCPVCGERIGHWGGSDTRAACNVIPVNVPLEEVRPNCYLVRREWIGDAIRAACDKKGA